MNTQEAEAIIRRLEDLMNASGVNTLQSEIDSKLNDIQEQIDRLTHELEQNSAAIKDKIAKELTAKLTNIKSRVNEAKQGFSEIEKTLESLQKEVGKIKEMLESNIQAAVDKINKLQDKIRDEFTEEVKAKLEEQLSAFVAEITQAADRLSYLLQEQLQALMTEISTWLAEQTEFNQQEISTAITEQTQRLVNEMEQTLKNLLNQVLLRFRSYLQQAEDSLVEAVQHSSASREAIQPALDQLKQAKQMIDVVIDQVRDLADSVGISL